MDRQTDRQTDGWMASQLFLHTVQLNFKVTCARIPDTFLMWEAFEMSLERARTAQNLMIKLQ